jgi:nitrite reductase/ring-hydroxylating ferredoxin subunit
VSRGFHAGTVAELSDGQPRRVEVDGAPVLVVRVGESIYACGAVCTHKGGPLAEGKLSGTRLACPWHGWMYDVRTGECVFPGRGARVPTYATRVEGDDVWVETPSPGAGAC